MKVRATVITEFEVDGEICDFFLDGATEPTKMLKVGNNIIEADFHFMKQISPEEAEEIDSEDFGVDTFTVVETTMEEI